MKTVFKTRSIYTAFVFPGCLLFLLVSAFSPVSALAAKAADPQASSKTQVVLDYLTNLPNNGNSNRVVAGQHTYMWDNLISTIHSNTGKYVGIIGIDYFYENNASTNNQAIAWFNAHSLISVVHHLDNPKTGGDSWDTNFTDTDMVNLITPGQALNTTFNGVLNSIAAGLTTLQNAGVVVLYRPFHEQDGDWFWWGGQSTTNMINLWKYVFNYMTTTKGLHNLLWVWSTNEGLIWSYYPGSAYVDIVGTDLYSTDSPSAVSGYSSLSTYGKPFALTEYGPCRSSCTSPQDMLSFISAVKSNMPKMVYWMNWAETFSLAYNSDVTAMFADPWVITQDEIVLSDTGGQSTPTGLRIVSRQ